MFGVGYGWLRREYESHGIPFDQRRAIAREKLLMIKSLWTTETSEFEGDHMRLAPSRQGPKPLQQPHPPIHLGAALGPKTKTDLVEFADGWIPLGRYPVTSTEIESVQAAVAVKGREPLEITAYLDYTETHRIEELAAAGCDRVVLCLPTAPAPWCWNTSTRSAKPGPATLTKRMQGPSVGGYLRSVTADTANPNSSGLEGHVLKTRRAGTSDLG